MKKSKEVSEFIEKMNNPLKDEINLVREIILLANDKIIEEIKWSAPSFSYKGNMATFNPRAKKFVNLTFHKGALIPDKSGILEGDKKEARVARFYDKKDIQEKKDDLINVVNAWVALMDK